MPPTLLLADDSVTIQRVIELTFADEDVRVVAVSDGDQAISVLNQTPPDIVLADIGMPGRNGYEVAGYIRDTPRLSHIPVLLLTGAFEPVDQARATEVGCDGVLAKPFEPQLVISRVKELLARPKQAATFDNAALSAGPHEPAPPPWTAIFDGPVAPAPPTSLPPSAQIDNYFDRLDAAFTNLSNSGAADGPRPDAARSVADEIDWIAKAAAPNTALPPGPDRWEAPPPAPSFADLPLSYPPPPVTPAAFGSEIPTFPAPPPAIVPPAPMLVAPPTLPPLADAFAALLAAEQSAPASFSAAASSPDGATPSAQVLSEDAIEEATRRVLSRLSDRVVRETVAKIVSAVAERLVREEIERIKSAIE